MACMCGGQLGPNGNCFCGQFTAVEDVIGETLTEALGPVVDCVRDLYTQLGARAYQVSLVWTRWTGRERGVGNEYVVEVFPLLPTPLISDLMGVALELKPIGSNEQGDLTVTELSPRYDEDLLLGRAGPVPKGRAIPGDVSFFWEVYLPDRRGHGVRRRFTPSSAPSKRPLGFEWEIKLRQQEEPRLRDGSLS